MTNDYDTSFEQAAQPDADATQSGGGARYIGPRVRNRRTGEVRYWVQGQGYVGESDMRRLPQAEQRMVREARERASQLGQSLPDWRRFEELNRNERTGSYGQILGQALNVPPLIGGAGTEAEQEMRAIVDRWTPRQRVEGSGTTSDRDIAIFQGSLPNITRLGSVNSNIIRGIERDARRASEYADFLDWYWPRTGNLSGAQAQWQAYVNSNSDRSWREYFTPQRPQGVPQSARWNVTDQVWEE